MLTDRLRAFTAGPFRRRLHPLSSSASSSFSASPLVPLPRHLVIVRVPVFVFDRLDLFFAETEVVPELVDDGFDDDDEHVLFIFGVLLDGL